MFKSNGLIPAGNTGWLTEPPVYGTEGSSLDSWDQCSQSLGGPTGANNVNWVVDLPSGITQKYGGKGIMFRVGGIDGKFLPSVTLSSTKQGGCKKYVADSKGWIVVPISLESFLMYGNTKDNWPKNPVLEIALLTLIGRGPVEIVKVTNPINQRSGFCGLIKPIGYTKEGLKAAISVVGVFSPGLGGVVATATSITVGMIDKPNNPEPSAADVYFTFESAGEAAKAMTDLAKLKNIALTKAVTSKQVQVIFEPIAGRVFAGISLATTGASLVNGIQTVNNDYKDSCG